MKDASSDGAGRGGRRSPICGPRPSVRRLASERATERAGKPVHLKDIHLERGMQCVDCHFKQDNHGNGKLYGEPSNGVEIGCADCHGTPRRRATGESRRSGR